MKKHISIQISGRVQGVYFRASTKEKAKELGISGYVQNESDGSLYIEAEGNDEALENFIAWCKRGPELAEVSNCVIKPGDIEGHEDFVIYR